MGWTVLAVAASAAALQPQLVHSPSSERIAWGLHSRSVGHTASHSLPRMLSSTRHTPRGEVRMFNEEEEAEEAGSAGFGLNSLFRTSLFVTLWWALWTLYDQYLLPFSPVPELAILTAAGGYSLLQDVKRDPARAADSDVWTPWPCTTEGCAMEDRLEKLPSTSREKVPSATRETVRE
ncbi:hypothetical protein AB1Y20_012787 [Prymnesium parvum]|uniref:Uncharacterized protein n=1 Tax=Prymnesium parvum TaxID=97485 RepID=A0AB34IKU0_PRYPA